MEITTKLSVGNKTLRSIKTCDTFDRHTIFLEPKPRLVLQKLIDRNVLKHERPHGLVGIRGDQFGLDGIFEIHDGTASGLFVLLALDALSFHVGYGTPRAVYLVLLACWEHVARKVRIAYDPFDAKDIFTEHFKEGVLLGGKDGGELLLKLIDGFGFHGIYNEVMGSE